MPLVWDPSFRKSYINEDIHYIFLLPHQKLPAILLIFQDLHAANIIGLTEIFCHMIQFPFGILKLCYWTLPAVSQGTPNRGGRNPTILVNGPVTCHFKILSSVVVSFAVALSNEYIILTPSSGFCLMPFT